MKKQQITIDEYKNPLGSYTIIVNNARCFKENIFSIENVLKRFLTDREVFFGFYRIDCFNLTSKRKQELQNEIPSFFKKYGDIQKLSEYLSVARVHLHDYSFIQSVFDYYLETVLFNSRINWDEFKQYHIDYQNHRFEDIILNHFTEILFGYVDSSDFLICFNPNIYNPFNVRNIIDEAFSQ